MNNVVFLGLTLVVALAACAPASEAVPTPQRTSPATETLAVSPVPASTATVRPTAASTATGQLEGPFSRLGHSTKLLHLKCDPLEIIFSATVSNPNVQAVIFFFRMQDKASSIASSWSNGEDMNTPGNGNFEFILRAAAIPDEARFREAWLQYQFVAVNKSRQVLGRSQIFADRITFTPGCP